MKRAAPEVTPRALTVDPAHPATGGLVSPVSLTMRHRAREIPVKPI